MPASPDKQRDTLQAFQKAWKTWDPEAYLALLDDGLTGVTMPFAMGVPQRDRAGIERVLPILMRTVKNYEVTFHHVIHDVDAGKVAIYAVSKGETPVGPWAVEQALYVTFTESGDRIARLEEMLDSAWMRDFFAPKLGPYLASQGAELH